MGLPARKVTFSLHEDVLEELAKAVSQGSAASKNAFVERAIRNELSELRKQERHRRWEAAMQDGHFLKDLEETQDAFEAADAETARRIA